MLKRTFFSALTVAVLGVCLNDNVLAAADIGTLPPPVSMGLVYSVSNRSTSSVRASMNVYSEYDPKQLLSYRTLTAGEVLSNRTTLLATEFYMNAEGYSAANGSFASCDAFAPVPVSKKVRVVVQYWSAWNGQLVCSLAIYPYTPR